MLASLARAAPPRKHGPPESMERAYFTFDTTHHALWAEEVAQEAGLPVDVVPAPAAARARCNLALETLPGEVDALAAVLAEAGVPFGRWSGSA